MVWENGCVVIVMLTPLTESGVKQCYHYWPDEGSNLYHIYEVRGLAIQCRLFDQIDHYYIILVVCVVCSQLKYGYSRFVFKMQALVQQTNSA